LAFLDFDDGLSVQRPWTEKLTEQLRGPPSVGALLDMCEENYRLILRMAPDLAKFDGCYCSSAAAHQDLYLEVLEQSPYTSLVHLTYYFDHHSGQTPDPNAVLRVYHDARQLEVVDLTQRSLPTRSLYVSPGLLNKWKANLFVGKWLTFCLHQGHCFDEIHRSCPENEQKLAET
jgi:uncharacterized protein YqiB (DUF1249 family)